METRLITPTGSTIPIVKAASDVFANAIKHDFKSKNPTTRWNDIIKLK